MTKKKIVKIESVNEWLTYNQKEKVLYKRNIEYMRKYKEIYEELGKIAMVLFFLRVKLGIRYVAQMLYSASKQRNYVFAVFKDLHVYGVEKEYSKMFENDIDLLYKRIEHIWRIIKEDIHLTKYEPFFNAVGYDSLVIEQLPTYEEVEKKRKGTTPIDDLAEMADKWNNAHRQEVNAHLKSINSELERYEKHQQMLKEQNEAEKMARREARKALTAEVREIKKNAKAHRAREKKIEKSFARYYG